MRPGVKLLRTLPPFERGIVCAGRLAAGKPITTAWLRQRFNLSKAQAKRDMDKIECALPVKCERAANRRVVLTLGAA